VKFSLTSPGTKIASQVTTTLIVSLGIISKPRELVIIEVAVFLLVAQAMAINRLAGLRYPFWSPPGQTEQ